MRLPNTYWACLDGLEIAAIQENNGIDGLWFWYGDGVNTASRPATLEECKAEIKEHFKFCLAR